MNTIKDLLDYQIYPNIYSKLIDIFPEFSFKKIKTGYQSSSDLKIDSTKGLEGKVYAYDNNISHFIDYTRGSISIWDYIQNKKGLTNFETLQILSQMAGIVLPESFKGEEFEIIKEINKKSQIWEDSYQFFIDCLNNSENEYFNQAKKIKTYLLERGYSDNDINLMQLGFIPSQKALNDYLLKKDYKEEDIKSIELNIMIGESHKLTIPYREPTGRIRGISVRNINYKEGDKLPKYLYSTGLKRDDILFNLKAIRGDRDLILVEGPLDALYASVKGFDNVSALGGTSLNLKQVETAKRYGAKKITLILDNDNAGKQATIKAIDVIRNSDLKAYVATLPEGIKDPDQLIREKGEDSFKQVIQKAETYFSFLIDHITSPYSDKEITDKDRDEIITATYDISLNIFDPIDKEIFYAVIQELTNGAVTREGFNAKAKELKLERQKQKQERDINNLIINIQDLIKIGKVNQSIELLEEGNKKLKIESAQDLIERYTFQDFINEIKLTPPTLKTGITTLDNFCGIPHGAITLVAGRPSHGKTTFMFNLMLNMSYVYPRKKFYFFSYEEQKKFILIKILNRLINKDILISNYTGLSTNLERLKAYLKDNRTDITYIEEGKQKLKSMLEKGNIEIIDKPYVVEDLASVINHLHSKESIGAVFIDYIQRIRTNFKNQDKRIEIANISDYILNNIAKETGLPVILGAQFNRGAGESPKLEHLKEAGNLEEDANLVLSVYQEARENDSSSGKRDVELEIKALKNRDGAVNNKTVLKFDRYTGNICDYDSTWGRR